MQLPNELNSKRQDPEDEYKTKMYQLMIGTPSHYQQQRWNPRLGCVSRQRGILFTSPLPERRGKAFIH